MSETVRWCGVVDPSLAARHWVGFFCVRDGELLDVEPRLLDELGFVHAGSGLWVPLSIVPRLIGHPVTREGLEALGVPQGGAPAPASAAEAYSTAALLADYYEERRVVRKRKQGSLDFIEKRSKTLLRLLPPLARDITHEVLLGYVKTRHEEGAGEVVRKEILSVLRPALKLAYKSDRFDQDPRKVIPELESLSKPRERALTPTEAWGLCLYFLGNARLRIRAAHVAYAVAIGADPAAMPRAVSGDVRDDYGGAIVHGTKNDRRERLAVTPLPLQRAMLRFALGEVDAFRSRKTRSKRKPGAGLFPPWANAVRDLKLACEALGIPRCSPTDFRRTYATWMGQHGIRDELIQRCMGHASTTVLDRHYRMLTGEDLIRLVEQDYARYLADTWTAQSPRPPTGGPLVRRDGIARFCTSPPARRRMARPWSAPVGEYRNDR